MLGLGPGALTKDAYRIGIDLLERRAPWRCSSRIVTRSARGKD
jgi:hypothetical protein